MTIDEIKGVTEEEINLEILGILNEEKEINLLEMTRECEKSDRKQFMNFVFKELIDMGCYTQINSSSVLKPRLFRDKYRLFKKRAQYFLSHNLVHCVASSA